MARNSEAPKKFIEGPPMDDVRYTHPAFGNIRVNRVSSGKTLYGSDFVHHSFISITISGSEHARSLSNDRHFAKGEKIEVALSESQWATLVSSFNQGSGVPCTICRENGGMTPEIENVEHCTEQFSEEMNTKVAAGLKVLEEAASLASDKEKKPTVAKLRPLIERALMQLANNIPFVQTQFDEHMEETTEKAKVEAHAYLNGLVQKAGLDVLVHQSETVGSLSVSKTVYKGGEEFANKDILKDECPPSRKAQYEGDKTLEDCKDKFVGWNGMDDPNVEVDYTDLKPKKVVGRSEDSVPLQRRDPPPLPRGGGSPIQPKEQAN